ncbi:hypothetical protein [Candidatus Coxiella mudrowiae]|uniref:hypothetical protein n=1 Tax=Candidatus Coxiella mudrowiae TaxID=2054173 RepID=UPI0012FF4283|nr:hypothetical protein [Candidatus Coxiella mudrowiae]
MKSYLYLGSNNDQECDVKFFVSEQETGIEEDRPTRNKKPRSYIIPHQFSENLNPLSEENLLNESLRHRRALNQNDELYGALIRGNLIRAGILFNEGTDISFLSAN